MKNTIDTLIFDLDDTLYPKHLGICKTGWDRLASVFSTDMKYKLGIGHLSYSDFEKYGNDILRSQNNFDWDSCMEYICRQDVSTIQFNKVLKDDLESLSYRKILFTNGDYRHMERVLKQLNLSNSFDNKFTCFDSNFYFKPELQAFEIFFEKMKVNPSRCAFFEDSVKNLKIAKSYNMTTILISEEEIEKPDYCDFVFSDATSALKMFL